MRLYPESFLAEMRQAAGVFDEWAAAFAGLPAVADHLCYRCEDIDEFERARSFFEVPGAYLYQSWISGRRIAVIKLVSALPTVFGPISFLELSDQKPDRSQRRGFDHVEIHPTTGAVDDLVKAFAGRGFSFTRAGRPHHVTYDALIGARFQVRIEDEPLIEKIKREEMA